MALRSHWFPTFSAGLPDRILAPSEITLLKLHGSVGWFAANERHLAFNSDFLQMLFADETDVILGADVTRYPMLRADDVILDADADVTRYPNGQPLITHPSYLKRVQNGFLREIWRRADVVIRSADEVDIWGYSLPESDIAMSLLLAPLRWRAARGEAAICVHNPSGEDLDRYRSFFDGHARLDKKALG